MANLERGHFGSVVNFSTVNVVEQSSQKVRPGVAWNIHSTIGREDLSGCVTHQLDRGLDSLQKLHRENQKNKMRQKTSQNNTLKLTPALI